MDAPLPPLRILITDDCELVRHRLAQMLGELPDVDIVGEAGGVAETLAAVRALEPDVVTLDLSLPDGSGLEILRCTLGQPSPPLFVVLTGYSQPQYRDEALRLGAYAFLDKALEFAKAVDLIQSLAAAARQGRLPAWPAMSPSLPMRGRAAGP